MTMTRPFKVLFVFGLLLSLFQSASAQFSTCDTAVIYAHVGPSFHRLYVPNQGCSMYFYNPTPMYGIDAHITAANLNISQLIINDAGENTDLLTALYAQSVFPTNYQVWMGMTDSATTYTWRTFTGAPLPAYTNWRAGEPNNQSAPCSSIFGCPGICSGADRYYCAYGEDCAVLSSAGDWLDITCRGNNMMRICVLELNTCPGISKAA